MFQDVADLKGRQDGETVRKVVRSIAEASLTELQASLTEDKYFLKLVFIDFREKKGERETDRQKRRCVVLLVYASLVGSCVCHD